MFVHRNLTLRTQAFLASVGRRIGRRSLQRTFVLALFLTPLASAQIDTSSVAPDRYLVVYRNATIPGDAESRIASAGARLTRRNEHLGIAAVESPTESAAQSTAKSTAQDDATTLRLLAAQPNVEYVLHDRIVFAHRLRLQRINAASIGIDTAGQSPSPTTPIGRLPTHGPVLTTLPFPPIPAPPPPPPPPYDTYYTSTPQGWAVQQVGGYGNNVPGGPAHGPWDTTMGKGVRIAIIDSGVDQTHPDIAPNLALNLTEVDQTAYPSACDDGTPRTSKATAHGLPLLPPQPSAPAPDR